MPQTGSKKKKIRIASTRTLSDPQLNDSSGAQFLPSTIEHRNRCQNQSPSQQPANKKNLDKEISTIRLRNIHPI